MLRTCPPGRSITRRASASRRPTRTRLRRPVAPEELNMTNPRPRPTGSRSTGRYSWRPAYPQEPSRPFSANRSAKLTHGQTAADVTDANALATPRTSQGCAWHFAIFCAPSAPLMRIGVATAGVAAVIALGRGTAAATPSDPADTAGSSSEAVPNPRNRFIFGHRRWRRPDRGHRKSTDLKPASRRRPRPLRQGCRRCGRRRRTRVGRPDPTATAEPTTEDKSDKASTEPTAADFRQVAPDGAAG